MDSDDSSNYNDPGLSNCVEAIKPKIELNFIDSGMNMDSPPTPPEILNANMESVTPHDRDPLSGQAHSSSSQAAPESSSNPQLRCVNCGLNITRMRRHTLVVEKVRCLIQRWIEPQQVQVTSDSMICHCCWTAAWNEIKNPTPAGQHRVTTVGHIYVCVSCGTSILRKRSHTLNNDTPRENLIRNEVALKVAPRELSRNASICHNCWLRIGRATSKRLSNLDIKTEFSLVLIENSEIIQPAEEDFIVLPNYVRASATQSQCFLPNCNNSSKRLTVPNDLRVRLFCDYNYYVPPDCRICPRHLNDQTWDLLMDSLENPIHTFNARHIEEFASLLKSNMLGRILQV